ncbi:hypothetical protein ACJ6WF_01140 [Streptomyces sp. MMS24-I2-30]|uniref:hypothetical protein n=1 Tax=Streptomyces sp. MMS24-I2-30 TaxID=3351564 RepID=UPI003896E1EF
MLAAADVSGLEELPVLDLAAQRALELPMSKNSPLTPATAPALSAAALSGPPDATGPEVSRSVLTALFDRSTVRNRPSLQPFWSSAFTCWRLIPGPIFSVVSINGIPPVTGAGRLSSA